MKKFIYLTFYILLLFLFSEAVFAQFSKEKLKNFYVEDFQENLDQLLEMYVPMATTAHFYTFLQFEDGSYPDDFSLTMKMSPAEKSKNVFQKILETKEAIDSEIFEEKQLNKNDSNLNDYIMSQLHPNRVMSIFFEEEQYKIIVYQLIFAEE